MRKSILVLGSALMIITLMSLVLLLSHQREDHLIISGVVDATEAAYDQFPVISLDGDWNFYPGRFYTTRQLEHHDLSSDIAGGNAFGIDTCLITFGKHVSKPQYSHVKPTYTVGSFEQLLELLE